MMVKKSSSVSVSKRNVKGSKAHGKAKGAGKRFFLPMVLVALVLGSAFTSGLYLLGNPANNNARVLPVGPFDDSESNVSFGDDNLAAWAHYSSTVNSTEVIKIDPGLAQVKPGDKLEELSELEGNNNFTDNQPMYRSYYSPPGYALEDKVANTAAGAGVPQSGSPNPLVSKSSTTDKSSSTQVKREVEEADLVKVIGTKMFILNSYRGLIIVDFADPANARIVGQCAVVGNPVDMYVVDFLAIITVNSDYGFWAKYWAEDTKAVGTGSIGTMIYIVNAKDPANPVILKIVELEGFAAESRRVGHVIYQTTNVYSWYADPYAKIDGTEQVNKDYMVVTSIDLGSPKTLGKVDRVKFSGSANQVHASPTAFYVARTIYEDIPVWTDMFNTLSGSEPISYYTKVTYLDIRDPNGDIIVRDSFKAPGELFDKYQMDEYNQMFRMVTHVWKGVGESWLFIFNISNPNDIRAMGKLLIDDAGSLMATRFAGVRAYTIHLPRSVDPLDVLDLSDPKHPKLCDVFEMPGWVTHMDVYGDYIIALGVDNSGGQFNVAVSLFDVKDPNNVKMLDRVRIGGRYASSEANWEPKALTTDKVHKLVIVPLSSSSGREWNESAGVQFVHYDLEKGELDLVGEVMGPYSIERTRVVGEYVLATSYKQLEIIDINDISSPDLIKIIDLCVNVVDVAPTNGFFVQLVQDYGYSGFAVRSVASVNDLQALDQYELNSSWAKLFVTAKGLILAADINDGENTTGTLFTLKVASDGKLIVVKISTLPVGAYFQPYDDINNYRDRYYDVAREYDYYYPYYYSYYGTQETSAVLGDKLIVAVPKGNWGIYGYDERTNQYGLHEMQTKTMNLYVFDLSDLSAVPEPIDLALSTYQFIGLQVGDGEVFIQHQYTGYTSKVTEYGYVYAENIYYKNYALSVSLSDPGNGIVLRDYSIPGRLVGAGNNVLYTVTDYAVGKDGTLNVLRLDGITATVVSAIKLGEERCDVKIVDGMAYVINVRYPQYSYYDSNKVESPTTTVKVIDLRDPADPKTGISVRFDGAMTLEEVDQGHLMLYDSSRAVLMVYAIVPGGLAFDAMVHVQGYPQDIKVLGSTIYISEGYYGVVGTAI